MRRSLSAFLPGLVSALIAAQAAAGIHFLPQAAGPAKLSGGQAAQAAAGADSLASRGLLLPAAVLGW